MGFISRISVSDWIPGSDGEAETQVDVLEPGVRLPDGSGFQGTRGPGGPPEQAGAVSADQEFCGVTDHPLEKKTDQFATGQFAEDSGSESAGAEWPGAINSPPEVEPGEIMDKAAAECTGEEPAVAADRLGNRQVDNALADQLAAGAPHGPARVDVPEEVGGLLDGNANKTATHQWPDESGSGTAGEETPGELASSLDREAHEAGARLSPDETAPAREVPPTEISSAPAYGANQAACSGHVEETPAVTSGEKAMAGVNRPLENKVDEPVSGVLRELPSHLESFEKFLACHWVDLSGEVRTAPWLDASFTRSLQRAALTEIERVRFNRLWIFGAALERLDPSRAQFDSRDVEQVASLHAQPLNLSAGLDPKRTEKLRQALETDQLDERPRWKIVLFLQALRPSLEQYLGTPEIETLLQRITFESAAMSRLVKTLLLLGARGLSPVDHLRRACDMSSTQGLTSQQVAAKLEDKRAELHRDLTRVWNAGGGKIGTNHCKKAWNRFIGEVTPVLEKLYPVKRGGLREWEPVKLRGSLALIVTTHEEIAEEEGARFKDRHIMDRLALRLQDLALQINQLMEVWEQKNKKNPQGAVLDTSLREARPFIRGERLDDPVEELCRHVLVRVIQGEDAGEPAPDPMYLGLGDLCACPDLLELLSEPQIDWTDAQEVVAVTDLSDPVRAAAHLLERGSSDATGVSIEALRHQLQELRRFDLLGRMVSKLGGKDRRRIQEDVHARGEEVTCAADQLCSLGGQLMDLAVPSGKLFIGQGQTARTLCEAEPGRGGDLRLIGAWLLELQRFADTI
ncbi:MAG: hypothetical protein HY815_27600, partial [Candidatus Riflebacteria bacterium]|nr:hypothetical protein [Candidatus Riflebacteria bacterium]